MSDDRNPSRDLAWYRSRWDALTNRLSVSDPDAVVAEVDRLRERAETLTKHREVLSEIDLDTPETALRMIENMRNQLRELYAEKAAAGRVETPGGNTFEQLRAFHAFQEKLQRRLGVSTAENVLDMVESLTDQLEAFYLHGDLQDEASTATEQPVARASAAPHTFEEELGVADPGKVLTMVQNLTLQLEALYEQREQLSEQGIESVDHALPTVDDLTGQLRDASDGPTPRARRAIHPDIDPLIPDAKRRRLETMTNDALNALSVGALCLDDQGAVRRANERALGWPGVTADAPAALEGRNFFTELAPDTDTPLFRGQFEAGVDAGAMDLQLFYGGGANEEDPRMAVHFHRKPNRSENWILFRPRQ
jgi:photoactive yellow protein